MGLKELYLKFKALKLRPLFLKDKSRTVNKTAAATDSMLSLKPPWMTPVSHGYHVVIEDDESQRGGYFSSPLLDNSHNTILIQREQLIDGSEVWLYGISDAKTSNEISRYLQSTLFDKKPKESVVKKIGKETMLKAYVNAKSKFKDQHGDITLMNATPEVQLDSASLMVINGEKLILANLGDCRAVVCKDGIAFQLGTKLHQTEGDTKRWPRRCISGALRMPRVNIQSNTSSARRNGKTAQLVSTEKVDSEVEFVILASKGVWEVMKNQEAVSLVRHIQDPQAAAECITREALARMSRGSISCLVVRFDHG